MKKQLLYLVLLCFTLSVSAQLPTPAIVGYWESWSGNKFVKLSKIDSRYNVIQISFASLESGNDYQLSYSPPGNYTDEEFKTDVANLQAEGKKVLISIGGQNDHIVLDNADEKNAFVTSMNGIVDEWGFDGIDIDLEGSSLNFKDINIANPGDARQLLMMDAIKEIMSNHRTKHGKKLLLTMAPETIYVMGALSEWAGAYRGAYLPMIEALKDSIDMLNVQLYNSGSMFGLDGQAGGEFRQGNADFVLAMTEAVIRGFTGTGNIGTYSGFPASKVGVGLPGCHSSDAVPHKELEDAMNHLLGKGPQPGKYELKTKGGYPDLKGMMTWSINSDKTCGPSYGYVDTWSKIFTDSSYIEIENTGDIYEFAENGGVITVELFNNNYATSLDTSKWKVDNLPEGVELDSLVRVSDSLVNIVLKGNSSAPYPAAIWNVTVSVDSTQFAEFSSSLTRVIGVLLKKTRITIPGVLQGEDLSAKKSAYTHPNFRGEEGLMLRFNEGYHADYEIDVKKTGYYSVDIKFASSAGSYGVQLKVDGQIASIQTISTTSKWDDWDTTRMNKVKLDSGHHVLNVKMTKGWMHYDWIHFQDYLEINSVQELSTATLEFYPNPTQNLIYFGESVNGLASITDLNGRELKSSRISGSNASLDVSSLKPGVYLVKLTDNNGAVAVSKLIKK